MSKRSLMTAYGCAALVAALATHTVRANAAYERVSAQVCTPSTDSDTYVAVNGAMRASSATDVLVLRCAFDDEDDLDHIDVAAINVHLYDGDNGAHPVGNIQLQACVKYFDTVGGSCGTIESTSTNPGVTTEVLDHAPSDNDLVAWESQSAPDFPYLYITLHGSNQELYGFYYYAP